MVFVIVVLNFYSVNIYAESESCFVFMKVIRIHSLLGMALAFFPEEVPQVTDSMFDAGNIMRHSKYTLLVVQVANRLLFFGRGDLDSPFTSRPSCWSLLPVRWKIRRGFCLLRQDSSSIDWQCSIFCQPLLFW